jgi:hypothetical protein
VAEEFGEINFVAGKPGVAVLLDGKVSARSLPHTLKVPAGKYTIKAIEAGKVLLERQVQVKPGEVVNLALK